MSLYSTPKKNLEDSRKIPFPSLPKSADNSLFSLFMSGIDKILSLNDVKKQYSPRKKFRAAKIAMGDDHCDDVDSNRELRKALKLSKQKYYSAINAMRNGRDVGVNGRPTYLHDEEKVDFWNWVRSESHIGHCLTIAEMRQYVTDIVKKKRPSIMRKRCMVSARYIKTILKEGEILLDKCVNTYTAKSLITVDEANEFFRSVHDVVQKYHIDSRLILNMDESWVSPQDEAPRCKVAHGSGDIPMRKIGRPGQHYTLIGCITASGLSLPSVYIIPPRKKIKTITQHSNVPYTRILQSANGWITDKCMITWINDHLIPWVNDQRRLFGCKDALLVADAHGTRYNARVMKILQANHIHVVIIPAGATSLLQPLDVGIYGPYNEYLKTHLHGSKAVDVINASEAVFHDAFSYDNIVHAWDKTTMLTDDHSSILDQLPKENPVRRNVHSSRISGKVLF